MLGLRHPVRSLAVATVTLGLLVSRSTALAGQPSGEEIEREISQAIESLSDAKVDDLQVYVAPNGTITLHGLVSSDRIEDRVIEAARRAGGGEEVHSQISVVNKSGTVAGR